MSVFFVWEGELQMLRRFDLQMVSTLPRSLVPVPPRPRAPLTPWAPVPVPPLSPSSREHTCSCAVSKFVALGMSNFVSVRVRRTYQFRAFVCGVESQTWKRSFGKIWWRGLEDWWRYVNSE